MPGFRSLLRLSAAVVAASLVALSGGGTALGAPEDRRAFPDVIALPDGFRPEGIAIRGTTAYLGSLGNGDIYAANLVTGSGEVISAGTGAPSVGLAIDQRDRLFVAGGASGEARVVDVTTGDLLATYPLADAPTFINDVVLSRDVAWFTDSSNPVLHGLPLARNGGLTDAADVITLPLGGDYQHLPGFNLNGIELTPDGEGLLAVQSASGTLFRIDPATGVATAVDLGGSVLVNGDGLLLQGRTLYVVQNRLNQVAVVELDREGTSGVVVDVLTSPEFDVPTTVAWHGNSLYLPNARFSTPPTPETTYTLVRIPR